MNNKDIEEYIKCKENPYYFMTTYMYVTNFHSNKKELFTTHLSEEQFNELFKAKIDNVITNKLNQVKELNHEKL